MTAVLNPETVARQMALLDASPTLPAVTFRGRPPAPGPFGDLGLKSSMTVTCWQRSSSFDLRLATCDFQAPQVYAILGRTGRTHSSKVEPTSLGEVVFPVGSMFGFCGQFEHLGVDVVMLLEIVTNLNAPNPHGHTTPGELQTSVCRIIEDQRQWPAKNLAPGRFRGPLWQERAAPERVVLSLRPTPPTRAPERPCAAFGAVRRPFGYEPVKERRSGRRSDSGGTQRHWLDRHD